VVAQSQEKLKNGGLARTGKLAALLRIPAFRGALRHHRVAAGVEHAQLLQGLGCRTAVDIGANRGQFSLVTRHCFPDAQIISFEPLRGPAEIFRRIFEGDTSVELHQVAIGDDSSSLLPITALQNQVFPGTQETGTTAVEVRRLDEVLKPDEITAPALLKLDMQDTLTKFLFRHSGESTYYGENRHPFLPHKVPPILVETRWGLEPRA